MSEGRLTRTILSVAYPLLPVTSGSGGGAEQILYLVERGLVAAGFRSIVVAAKGSHIGGELIPTSIASELITNQIREQAQQEHRAAITSVLKDENVDLIHFHGLDFPHYLIEDTRAVQLATLHLPVSWYESRVFESSRVSMNCVSHSQAASVPPAISLPVIPNGVDVSNFHVSADKTESLLWLGRICPEKGAHIALNIAHRLKMPLIIAGPVHPFASHERYFQEQVQPLLDNRRRYVGPIGLERKVELLAQARCLLIPSLAPETSSLVAMEAASAGTSVIAYRSGALPEIVEQGISGFLVDSEEEMAEAVGRSSEISPDRCRAVAEKRFEAGRMVADYIALYERLINAHPRGA